MRKLDRLMAIVMALQHRPETAQSLADKLEVSKRTIIRDMQALSEMGVPIYSLPGPQGGYRLMEGYKLPPLHLTSDEALVVMFALNAMTKIADTPFNQARWTALDKIRAILPEQTLHEIEPLLTRLELDIPSREYSTPHLETIVRHAAASRWIRVYYRSENRQRWLHLKPKRVYMAHGFWYTEAYSLEHRETRTFRIDRMLEIQELEKPPREEPIEEEAQAAKLSGHIRIRAALTYRGALLAEQNRYIGQQVKQISDDQWLLDFMCPLEEWQWAVKFFYSLALDAEVLEPLQLREEVRHMAEQVSARYEQVPEEVELAADMQTEDKEDKELFL
ncbi:DeoR family transcriptional regulator [Insulibacter thermoxylanivorax]|uniref:DeoR family transcriptional regulator n=1 Tax=Insulibacter thermoxylanivorax TaxID=2749268 RepID=A0A916VEU0_9BACL|nr:YafY family protein [Insulibacter thermoxylanivorax]GFR37582.1 DeoR family transcriptional regulator [Insulibacter thermoxylanivorax]